MRECQATNTEEVTTSRASLVEVGLQNEEEDNDENAGSSDQEDQEDFDKYFGDFPRRVPEGQIRISFVNIYGIPNNADHPKNNQIRESINKLGSSITGLAETNIHWNKVRGKDRWEERTRGWWENNDRHIMGNNNLESPQYTHQPGGVMTTIRDKSMFRVIKQGVDPSRMGRWCWSLLSGKRGVTTRIITAYRPCISRGLKSTYRQQKRILDAKKCNICPRKKMLDDLTTTIENWMEHGDQIILMIDLNESVINSNAAKKLNDIGLTEIITQRHNDKTPFSTCNKGQNTIDGIFTSSTIHITKGGYLPFTHFPTDHRALWIDVSMANLCGSDMAPITAPQARRLKCNDPKTQEKWIKLYTQYLNERRAITRAYRLQDNLHLPLTDTIKDEYEKLRTIRMDARIYADKRCRKLHMGGVPFSADLAKARSHIELWKAIVAWKMGKKHNMKHIQRLEKKCNKSGCRDTTLKEAKDNKALSFQHYWEVKRQAQNLRTTFLRQKANELALTTGTESDNIYHQLILREAQRTTSRKIKFTLNRAQGGGVTKVSLLNSRGEWEETTSKTEIEQGCAQENSRKYRQTENTPCMQGRLAQDLGFLGNSPASQEILDGTYNPPVGTNEYVREFLQQLKYDPNAKDDSPMEILTTEDYIDGWKKKKEQTSAGKSGWTFSHSKTCALNTETANFEATMAHIPYVTGYAPKEWRTGVNIMIYKKANLDRVDKLRTIVLKEADSNFNDGKMGRDMMNHAEKKNMIAKEQYGSRKGHCSIDHAVNKRLTFDLFRLYRSPGAVCSNDAKSCYDRILHSIAALAMKRLGVPEPPIHCMLTCIQQMDHFIRTTHGDSTSSYTSKYTRIPFQGVLQGNGAAPSIWVAVSTPLLNMMRAADHGLHLISAIAKEASSTVAFAFVDDTDLVQGNPGNNNISANDVMEEMQQSLLRWEGGLKATGGALVPEKSFVYPIDFTFNNSGIASYKNIQEIAAHFEAPNAEGIMTELEQLDPSEARETLGVYLAPDGNNREAATQLKVKAKHWSDLVLTGHLSAKDVRLALDTTVIKSLEYPLTALTLSEKQCKTIMAPILAVALPKTKVSRTFPRDVVYGPKSLMGLGLNNLYYVQGSKHIAMLHQFVHTDTITGELMRSCIEITKIYVGHGSNIFTLNYERLGHLSPPSWISNLWHFCHKYEIQIDENHTPNVITRRVNDKFLMETIAAGTQFTNNELSHINRCRLYLQIMTLSDITNGNGTLLRQGVLKGNIQRMNESHYLWPRQTRPGVASWRLWRKAIKTTFMREINLHLKIEYHLGPWNDGSRTGWKWFLVRETQKLYQRVGNRWKVHTRAGRGRRGITPSYTYLSDALSIPASAKRCTVFQDLAGKIRLTGSGRDVEPINRNVHTSHTFLDNVTYKGNVGMILQSLRDGSAKAVSDGSFLAKEKLGTAAFIVEGAIPGNYIIGDHETPGSADSQCAHRSEMFGMLALIIMVNRLCDNHGITSGEITAKCDGEGTIKILNYRHKITKNSRKHFDLIQSINSAIQVSPLQWTFLHLDGHQDDYLAFEELDRWAQLNVIVDKNAKRCLTSILHNASKSGPTIYIPYVSCTIRQRGDSGNFEPISSHLASTVLKKIQNSNIKDYWKRKKNFSDTTVNLIDWEGLKKSASTYDRIKWLSKFVTGICGVGHILKLWKHQAHSTCPRCGQEDENTQHVVVCKELSAKLTWDKALTQLNQWMKDNNSDPDMREVIIEQLNTWRDNPTQPPRIIEKGMTRLAQEEQSTIGWDQMLQGFTSLQWKEIQARHLRSIGSWKSPILWISKFQKRIWEIPWMLWQHRNEFLHSDGSTIHYQETVAINNEIRAEYNIRGGDLPVSYLYLFQQPMEVLLNQPIITRCEWLASVWSARDHHTPDHGRIRNDIAESFYLRWKKQFN
jgi:hypothetical protein